MTREKNVGRTKRFFKDMSFWISIILSLAVLVIYIFSRPELERTGGIRIIRLFGLVNILDMIEAKSLDMRFKWRGERKPGDDIIIIAVDEKTEDELGRWQSSGRRWIAEMLDILHEGGAKVVGFAFVLAEPGESAALTAVEDLKTHYLEDVQGDLSNHAEMLAHFEEVKNEHDYDQQLAEAIQRFGNVVLGIYFFRNAMEAADLTPEDHETTSEIIKRVRYPLIKFPPGITRQHLRIEHTYGGEVNLPIFSDVAKSFGHFNPLIYVDGYIRHFPLLMEYQGSYYPSLALEIARTYLDLSPYDTIIHALGNKGGRGIHFIQLGNIHIPTDEKGRLLINYYGKRNTFAHYSISDVVLGKIPPETFKDKIVLLGFTAAIYQDIHPTTFQEDYPGVEVHATIIENILRQDFLTRPGATAFIDALVILLFGIVLGFVLRRTPALYGALIAIICLMGVAGIAYYAFVVQKIWLNITFPFLFVVLDYIAITTHKYFTEEKRKEEYKDALNVLAPIAEYMPKTKNTLKKIGEEQKSLTTLFLEIKGIPEILPPEDFGYYKELYIVMVEIIKEYGGGIDEYTKDMMKLFYIQSKNPNHAVQACKTAIEMLTRLNELHVEWEGQSLPPMTIEIGINSGDMNIVKKNSEKDSDYPITGDNVDCASQLRKINTEYGTHIIFSQSTYNLIPINSFIHRKLGSGRVQGKQEPVTIYELIGDGIPERQMRDFLATFEEGLDAYKKRRWREAIDVFREAYKMSTKLYSDGDTFCKEYIRRCEEYNDNPPPEDWDGTFIEPTIVS